MMDRSIRLIVWTETQLSRLKVKFTLLQGLKTSILNKILPYLNLRLCDKTKSKNPPVQEVKELKYARKNRYGIKSA